MRKMLLSSSLVILGLTSCMNEPNDGFFSDFGCTQLVEEVADSNFFTGYVLGGDKQLYISLDDKKAVDGLDISWTVSLDSSSVLSVEALGDDGKYMQIATLYPSSSDTEYVSYNFPPIKTSRIKLQLTDGIAQINEIKIDQE